jgi:DNA-binding CsgD family transcriptional regulator
MYELIEHLGVGVLAQRDARLVFANAFLAKLLRYETPKSLLGRSVWEIVHPDAQEELRPRLKASLLGDDSAYLTVLATASGEPEPVCAFPRLARDSRGEDEVSASSLLIETVLPLKLLENVPGLRVVPESGFVPRVAPTSAVRATATAMALGAEQFRQLTQREVEVVEGLTGGLPINELAQQLGISPNTVRNHLKSIFRKLNVRSQTELLSRLLVKSRGGAR